MLVLYVGILVLFNFTAVITNTAIKTSQPATLITFFIKPVAEQATQSTDSQETPWQNMLAKPAHFSRLMLQHSLRPLTYPGMYATYAGFVTHSDANGQITFPRKSLNDDLTLVVTARLQPSIVHGDTVQKLFLRQGFSAAYYHFQRMTDPDSKTSYWNITPIPTPADGTIPGLAVVLLADPEHIIVPQEQIVTISGPTLFLPTLYATKDMDAGLTALSFLKISKYFSLVNMAYQTGNDRYDSVIVP